MTHDPLARAVNTANREQAGHSDIDPLSRRSMVTALLGAVGALGLAGCAAAGTDDSGTSADQQDPSQVLAALTGSFNWFATIADLRAQTTTSLQAYQVVVVTCYSTPNDGGGGLFCWDPSSSTADNGGTVIQSVAPPLTPVGRWFRIFTGGLSVKWFGAKGDLSQNDLPAIQAAIAACPESGVVFLPGTSLTPVKGYRIDGPIEIKTSISLMGLGGMALISQTINSEPCIKMNLEASSGEVILDHLRLANGKYGIWLQGNELNGFSAIRNVEILSPFDAGLMITARTLGVVFQNINVDGGRRAKYGFYISGVQIVNSAIFDKCRATETTMAGLYIDCGFPRLTNGNPSGSSLEMSTLHCNSFRLEGNWGCAVHAINANLNFYDVYVEENGRETGGEADFVLDSTWTGSVGGHCMIRLDGGWISPPSLAQASHKRVKFINHCCTFVSKDVRWIGSSADRIDAQGFVVASEIRLEGGSTPTIDNFDGGARMELDAYHFGFWGVSVVTGIGSPQGSVTAAVGSLYMRKDGTAGSSLYVKEPGATSNTGWAKVVTTPA